jgi:hypothetical protein
MFRSVSKPSCYMLPKCPEQTRIESILPVNITYCRPRSFCADVSQRSTANKLVRKATTQPSCKARTAFTGQYSVQPGALARLRTNYNFLYYNLVGQPFKTSIVLRNTFKNATLIV